MYNIVISSTSLLWCMTLTSFQYFNLDGCKGLWGKHTHDTQCWKLCDQASLEDICELVTLIELHISGSCDEILEFTLSTIYTSQIEDIPHSSSKNKMR
jgi:hypothetical protein